MGKDTVAGAIKETGGKIRESIGKMTGDTEGEAQGTADKVTGNIQKNYGKLKDSLKDLADDQFAKTKKSRAAMPGFFCCPKVTETQAAPTWFFTNGIDPFSDHQFP